MDHAEYLALIRRAHRMISRLGGTAKVSTPAIVAMLRALEASGTTDERTRESRLVADIIQARWQRRHVA